MTFFSLLILLVIPNSFFGVLFGREFAGIKLVMLSLAVGILMLSISIILSPFFSGIGKPVHNAIGSGIGLIFTIILCLWFIPRIGVLGAGFAASISYSVATLYQFIVFFRYSKLKPVDFLLRKEELVMMRNEFRIIFMAKS